MRLLLSFGQITRYFFSHGFVGAHPDIYLRGEPGPLWSFKKGGRNPRNPLYTWMSCGKLVAMVIRSMGYPPGNDHISHQTGSSETHRLKMPFLGDILVPWRVFHLSLYKWLVYWGEITHWSFPGHPSTGHRFVEAHVTWSGFMDLPPEVLSVSVYTPSAYNLLGNLIWLRKIKCLDQVVIEEIPSEHWPPKKLVISNWPLFGGFDLQF